MLDVVGVVIIVMERCEGKETKDVLYDPRTSVECDLVTHAVV